MKRPPAFRAGRPDESPLLQLTCGFACVAVRHSELPAKLEMSDLSVYVFAEGRTLEFDWSVLATSLYGALMLSSDNSAIRFTFADRCLLEEAGWAILSSHGVIPNAWED